MNKICAKCKIDKPLSEYSKLSRASDGFNYRCKDCCNSYYNSIYKKIQQSKIKKSKNYYYANKQKVLANLKIKYNPIKKEAYNKIYNFLNKEAIRKNKNIYEKNRVLVDDNYRLIKTMRRMVRRTLANKKDSTFNILGYTKEELIIGLGGLPTKGDSVDHKIPVSWFIKNAPIHIVSSIQNLQIITRSENCKKSNKFSHSVDYSYYIKALEYIKNEYKSKITHNGK
jgi:hypothetical protein